MLNPHDDRTILANVDEVLLALKTNLAEHKEMVAEAKAGYRQKCLDALHKAEQDIHERLAIAHLNAVGTKIDISPITFRIAPPEDHSKEFETVIKMLELHRNAGEKTITLKAADVQRFVLNDWSWMDSFLVSNAGYSPKSMAIAAEKGLL
jgi:hypothetical protein